MEENSSLPSTSSYRGEILRLMMERDDRMRPYERIFESYGHLADSLVKARSVSARIRSHSQSTPTTELFGERAEEYQRVKEELEETRTRMNRNALEFMDAQRTVKELAEKLARVELERDSSKANQEKYLKRIAELEVALKKAKDDVTTMNDEKVSLNLAYTVQVDKIQQLEMEQMQLINTIRDLQEQKANWLNAEVDLQAARQQAKLQAEIASAIADTSRDQRTNSILSQCDGPTGTAILGDMIPTHAQFKFEAADSELFDVCWLNPDQFATGGQDKKIRLWKVDASGRQSKISTLTGFNNGVTRLDYDAESRHLLGSSNDSSVRLFNVDNQRLLTTLSGHQERVIVAKLHINQQAVSGGSDRSIKVWDLRAGKCIRSFFPGSTIHDIVARFSYGGNAWISGHFDKKIRVYDGRASEPVQTLDMAGRVTSLDVSLDGHSFLVSTRDDTLSLLDIRNLNTLHIYSADQYRTSSDYSRCVISPGMEYVAAGSSDGHVFVWNLQTTKKEKVLIRGGHEQPVLAVRWNPSGRGLLSCDKHKNVVLWT